MQSRLRVVILLILPVLVAGGIFWAGDDLWHPSVLTRRLSDAIDGLGPLAAAGYVLIYAVSPVLLIPATALSILAGVLFGPLWGGVWGLLGAMVAACVWFWLGRVLGRDFVERRARGKLEAIHAGIEREGWRFVVFLRFVPILPFAAVNTVLGATAISFRVYVVTTLVVMIPWAFLFAYAGAAGRAAASGAEGFLQNAGLAIGLLLLLTGLPAAVRYARARASRERAESDVR